MRYLLGLVAMMAMLLLPSAALANHVTDARSSATCQTLTVQFDQFGSSNKPVYYVVKVDGKVVKSGSYTFPGSSGALTISNYYTFTDNASHVVRVEAIWPGKSYHDDGDFQATVSNCCPPQPCCTPGEPGPPGPVGPAGPPAVPVDPSPPTTVERTTIIQQPPADPKTCVSRRQDWLQIKGRSGDRIHGVKAWFEGRKLALHRLGRNNWRVRIDMRGLTKGVYAARVRYVKNGKKLVKVQYFRPCYGNPRGGYSESLNQTKLVRL